MGRATSDHQRLSAAGLQVAASYRFAAPVRRRMSLTWYLTASVVTPSWTAISWSVRPCRSNRQTSCWRGVSVSGCLGLPRVVTFPRWSYAAIVVALPILSAVAVELPYSIPTLFLPHEKRPRGVHEIVHVVDGCQLPPTAV